MRYKKLLFGLVFLVLLSVSVSAGDIYNDFINDGSWDGLAGTTRTDGGTIATNCTPTQTAKLINVSFGTDAGATCTPNTNKCWVFSYVTGLSGELMGLSTNDTTVAGGNGVYFGDLILNGTSEYHISCSHDSGTSCLARGQGLASYNYTTTGKAYHIRGFKESSNPPDGTWEQYLGGQTNGVRGIAIKCIDPVLSPGINVTITNPLTGYFYGIDQLAGNNSNIQINFTQNETGLTGCGLNDSRFTLDYNTTSNYVFNNNTNLVNGNYHIVAYCNKTGTSNGTDTTQFYIDNVNPIISGLSILGNNQTIVYNGTLSTAINFTDDQEIYSINVTWPNGTILFNVSNLGQNNYTLDLNSNVPVFATGYFNARVCDAHTNLETKEVKKIKTEDYGLKYVMESTFFNLIDTEYIKIYPEDDKEKVTPKTEKLKDRYTFTFGKSESYIIESSHFIDIPKGQNYIGHLVIPGIANGHWVDFENDEATNYTIERISPNKVRVRIYGLKSKEITFNSLGELNCINQNFYYGNINPQVQINTDILSGQTTSINLTVLSDPSFISSINATLFYNNTLYYAGETDNFTQSITGPTFSGFNTTKSLNWIINIDGTEYNTTTQTQTIYNTLIDNCSNGSYSPLANVYFKDVETLNPSIVNVTLAIEGDLNYYTTMYNLQNFSICGYPTFINVSETINIQFTQGTSTSYYNLATYLDSGLKTINLYTQSGTSQTTFTIMDQDTSLTLEGVNAVMYRLIGGEWQTIESTLSDITGRAQFNYIPNTQYKFYLSKGGYTPYVFQLNPVLFSSYDILMTKSVTNNLSVDYDRISLYHSPKLFYDDKNHNFSFLISSPYDELIQYGFTITYPGGFKTLSGLSSNGEYLNTSFNIAGATETSQVELYYYYETELSGLREFTYTYAINQGNNTIMGQRGETYGLGILERVLISVLIVVFVVGISALVGHVMPGFGLGLITMGYLTYIGFIPLWFILSSVTVGVIILGSRPGG